MRRFMPLASILFVVLAACGGGDDDAAATPTAQPTAAASEVAATPGALATPDAGVVRWMREVCALDRRFLEQRAAIPGVAQDTTMLTLDQRRARAAVLWPAMAALHEAYVQDIARVTPPPRVRALHDAIRNLSVVNARELRRSIAEFDAIFASADAVEANNVRLQATERSTGEAVEGLFQADPPVRDLYTSFPDCAPPSPAPTP